MEKVIIESPYAGDVETNIAYAKRCINDSLRRGESPIASHLLYTQDGILDENKPEDRKLGIDAWLEWIKVADKQAVYIDHGISKGMQAAIDKAIELEVWIEYRSLEIGMMRNQIETWIDAYVELFGNKHDLDFDYWVADRFGTVACFSNEYFVDFQDIRLDLEHSIPSGLFFDWYNISMEQAHKNEPLTNYYTYLKTNTL